MFDYESLKLIWWLFIGVLLIGFAVTDGFDMGVAAWLPFLGRNDDERRVIINSVGAVWEGNQTWLITAGGGDFCSLAFCLCSRFFRLVCCSAACAFRPLFSPSWV